MTSKIAKPKQFNKWEAKLNDILHSLLPDRLIYPEFRFHEIRKWRFDFAVICDYTKIAFEIEGGTWSGGRHVHPIGFAKDCEKYNMAVSMGWQVYRLTPAMVTEDYLTELLFPPAKIPEV